MRCDQAKKIIPVYLDGELGQEEARFVKEHIVSCAACQKELRALERSWKMLGEWKDIDPVPGYVSRFWTEVSFQRPWHEKIIRGFGVILGKKRLVPVYAAVCVFLITGIFSLRNYWQMREAQELVASLDQEELEMAADVELAENFDVIQEMDFLEDLEVIENLDSLET
jgi:hypothetical protein